MTLISLDAYHLGDDSRHVSHEKTAMYEGTHRRFGSHWREEGTRVQLSMERKDDGGYIGLLEYPDEQWTENVIGSVGYDAPTQSWGLSVTSPTRQLTIFAERRTAAD
jgi:hypothetical protein